MCPFHYWPADRVTDSDNPVYSSFSFDLVLLPEERRLSLPAMVNVSSLQVPSDATGLIRYIKANLLVKDLQVLLRFLGLPSTGLKAVLQERLQERTLPAMLFVVVVAVSVLGQC